MVLWENRLIRKVNLKIHDVTIWEIKNWNTHIANISRSKGNQTMKFDQLVEYIRRKIFLKKSYAKCGGFPEVFLKSQN